MVEPVSLQQILSMGTQVEKVQQVQQQQHDVNVKQFAQEMRVTLDEKKIEVPVEEQGSEVNQADDHGQRSQNRGGEGKKQKDKTIIKNMEEGNAVQEAGYGGNINIKV